MGELRGIAEISARHGSTARDRRATPPGSMTNLAKSWRIDGYTSNPSRRRKEREDAETTQATQSL